MTPVLYSSLVRVRSSKVVVPGRGTGLVWESRAEIVWVRGRRGIRKSGSGLLEQLHASCILELLIPSSQRVAPA